ncbi:hypothetical protein K461DRAFT_273468 [Myriangium duriaei CBS 260.36]|uniref:Uncharacterized protein n=1 Tax=Myriangium duriaei CBS 260.36 TaxID=1168546 RepID=A0A9P4J8I7_9PEZI|nr:hypothetical protein K461DRAFT_273468 [Myriangium duriaei CBS 260.36]
MRVWSATVPRSADKPAGRVPFLHNTIQVLVSGCWGFNKAKLRLGSTPRIRI